MSKPPTSLSVHPRLTRLHHTNVTFHLTFIRLLLPQVNLPDSLRLSFVTVVRSSLRVSLPQQTHFTVTLVTRFSPTASAWFSSSILPLFPSSAPPPARPPRQSCAHYLIDTWKAGGRAVIHVTGKPIPVFTLHVVQSLNKSFFPIAMHSAAIHPKHLFAAKWNGNDTSRMAGAEAGDTATRTVWSYPH